MCIRDSFNGNQANTWTSSQTQSYNSFISGNPSGFSLTNLFNVSQNPSNNFYGSQMMAQNQMQTQIDNKIGLQEEQLGWNGGWMSAQNCQTVNGRKVCNVVTPGNSISAASNNTQNLSNLRLAAQSKFDQIIQTLVEEMVKTGLNKLMQSGSSSNGNSSNGSTFGGSAGGSSNTNSAPGQTGTGKTNAKNTWQGVLGGGSSGN